jgi:membrane associated rhomboid family serine protease
MLVWLVLCMIPGVMGNVANVAHVVGLLGGVVFAYAPHGLRRLRTRR